MYNLKESTLYLKSGENTPGVYLKKIDRGARLIFYGSEIFYVLIFLGLENLSYFFESEDFSLIFLG